MKTNANFYLFQTTLPLTNLPKTSPTSSSSVISYIRPFVSFDT